MMLIMRIVFVVSTIHIVIVRSGIIGIPIIIRHGTLVIITGVLAGITDGDTILTTHGVGAILIIQDTIRHLHLA